MKAIEASDQTTARSSRRLVSALVRLPRLEDRFGDLMFCTPGGQVRYLILLDRIGRCDGGKWMCADVPRSHRWNLLPITGLVNNMEAIYSVLNNEQRKQFQPVAIELKRGEASFHHPLMVHGSFENRTGRERRAAVINVFRDGVISAANEPTLQGVPAIRKGEKMGGQFFPLLFDPALA